MMRVAYISEKDTTDINMFSGISYWFSSTFEEVFEHVDVIHVADFMKMTGPVDDRLRSIGVQATRALDGLDVDVIICQGNSAIPYLETDLPVTYWHDSTWSALFMGHMEQQLSFDEFCRDYPQLKAWDEKALNRSTLVIFAADWLVDLAVEHYGISRSKLKVVPWAANMEGACDSDEADRFIRERPREKCNLVFLGKDWRRKGLSLAVELTKELDRMGLNTQLVVMGCEPDLPQITKSSLVRNLGFLDKAKTDQLETIRRTLRQSHFLIHPASFECFGCALAEANSFGVPIVGTPVTGLLTVVKNGRNGCLFHRKDFVHKAARYIKSTLGDFQGKYEPIARSAYKEYKTRLNWSVSGRRVRELLLEIVENRSQG